MSKIQRWPTFISRMSRDNELTPMRMPEGASLEAVTESFRAHYGPLRTQEEQGILMRAQHLAKAGYEASAIADFGAGMIILHRHAEAKKALESYVSLGIAMGFDLSEDERKSLGWIIEGEMRQVMTKALDALNNDRAEKEEVGP